jgi:hypothetical protein
VIEQLALFSNFQRAALAVFSFFFLVRFVCVLFAAVRWSRLARYVIRRDASLCRLLDAEPTNMGVGLDQLGPE